MIYEHSMTDAHRKAVEKAHAERGAAVAASFDWLSRLFGTRKRS
ncbi:MAG: hypothetical protein AAF330_00965 [Pseudomonadota bacterium]